MSASRAGLGAVLLYVVGALIIADQLSETFIALSPMRFGEPAWRFGATGVLLGRATPLVIGDVLITMAAFLRLEWQFLRIWAWLHLLAGVTLLLGLGLFGLDALTVRRVTQSPVRETQMLAAVRALGVGGVAALVSIWTFFRLRAAAGRVRSFKPADLTVNPVVGRADS